MCGGGGGGGDGGAAREAERQKNQNSAIGRVNRLFGINDAGSVAPDKKDNGYYRYMDVPDSSSDTGTSNRRIFDEETYNADLAAWEAQKAGSAPEAAANKTARENIYTGLKDDTFNYYLNDLNKQYTDTNRNAKFSLSDKGLLGGSFDLDTQNDIQSQRDRATLDIGNRADSAANKLRASDEQARLDLISRINAGMSGDAAIQSANTQLSNSVNDIRSNATSNSLGQVFKDYATIMTEQAKARGRASGSTFTPNPGSYYGSTN